MTETQQSTVFGDTVDEQVFIKTTGRVIRPFKRMLGQFAQEYKIHFTPEKVHVRVVDSANVGMIEIEVPADTLEEYDVEGDGYTLGISGNGLGTVLQHARYGKTTDDPIQLTADDTFLESTVERPLGDADATLTERVGVLDPDSIRMEPELPELEFGSEVDLAPETFIETIESMNLSNAVKLGSEDDSLLLTQETDIQKRHIELDVTPSEPKEDTYYSGKYLEMMTNALRFGYVDDLTLKWDEEFPMMVDFEREDVYSGWVMIAPRVKSE